MRLCRRSFSIPNHSKLNPRLWCPDGTLRPEAAEISNRVFVSVMSTLSVFMNVPIDLEHDVIDVLLCGSCVEYSYTSGSDLDMKIIVNSEKFLKKMSLDMFITLSRLIRDFFIDKYSPSVCGIKMDIGIISKVHDMPAYSLKRHCWVKRPRRYSKQELQYVKSRARLYYCWMLRQVNNALKDKESYGHRAKLFSRLKNRRNQSWEEPLRNKSPYSIAYSRFNRSRLSKKLLIDDAKNTRKLIMDINTNPS